MRIALLPSSYSPAVGGVEILTARLAAHLVDRGHAVEVWTGRSPGDGLSESEIIDGIRVRRFVFALPRFDLHALPRLSVAAVSTLSRLRRAAKEFRPDVLHVQCFSANGVYATALSRLLRLPLVVTLQGETLMDDHDIYERSLSLRLGLRLGLRRASEVTACSGFVLDDARRRFGLPPSKGRVIFNGVDLDEVDPEPVVVPFQRFVLGVGRVVWKKGFDLLVDAFSRIAAAHPDIGLVIAGTGDAVQPLSNLAADRGLTQRVHFTGPLGRGEVVGIMRAAEMLVVPSRIEPFGIVALEAWRAGVPLVVTSRGGAAEFVDHGKEGLVVDPLDVPALADSIEALLVSPDERLRLVEGGTRRLPAFLWERLTTAYEDAYQGLSSR